MTVSVVSVTLAFLLALVHVLAPRLRFLGGVPRSRWLSIAGGVSIAYVFVHVLPELHVTQQTLERAGGGGPLRYVESHAYLVALAGLCVFYGLERLAVRSRSQNASQTGVDETPASVFWLHVGSFAVYNAMIGYLLLHRERGGVANLIFFFTAIALHFVVNDFGLREHHRERYRRLGRWLLAGAVLLGSLTGLVIEIHEAALAVLFAVLAGGMIMNVIKEELPKERQSRFVAFAAGAAVYSLLLIFG